MAATLAGAQLTAEHRSAQLALRAVTVRQVLQVWPAFDPEHIGRSWPPVEKALLAVIGQRRADSASLAAGYFEAFRATERIGGTATPHQRVRHQATARAGTNAGERLRDDRAAGGTEAPDPARALVRVSGGDAPRPRWRPGDALLASARVGARSVGRGPRRATVLVCAYRVRGPVYGEDWRVSGTTTAPATRARAARPGMAAESRDYQLARSDRRN
jgi:hypothetical protein